MTKTGKARVLTSSACLRLLKEREDKKHHIAEEKEGQKKGELKKQQKEQEQKRKAEGKACKLAEAEKARKLEEKGEKAKEKAEKAKERSKRLQENAGANKIADEGSTSERAYQRRDMDENINTNVRYGTWTLTQEANGWSVAVLGGFMKIASTMKM